MVAAISLLWKIKPIIEDRKEEIPERDLVLGKHIIEDRKEEVSERDRNESDVNQNLGEEIKKKADLDMIKSTSKLF